MTFWFKEPTILVKQYDELWPSAKFNIDRKLNAISRTVIVLSVLAFLWTMNIKIIFSCIATLGVIVILHNTIVKKEGLQLLEGSLANDPLKQTYYDTHRLDFESPSTKNPFMNVLLTDCVTRKPAAAAYDKNVEKDIYENVKNNSSALMNDKRLYCDLGDNANFEQSMRQFYTNPSTSIPNDQKAFGEWLYGNMPSCKGGDSFKCLQKSPGAHNPSP